MPGSARMRLEIRKDGTWAMGNQDSLFRGTWKKQGDDYDFLTVRGPQGPLPEPSHSRVWLEGADKLHLKELENVLDFTRLELSAEYIFPEAGGR